ncbi:MAG: PAS domain-containing protein [Planctomycetaceae bacterium]|nr:PAS domain-containing protein [Planctomycetaceae bacterium]
MASQPEHQSLPPVSPDIVEQEQPDDIDNIVPTRGYQMLPMVGLGGSAGSIAALLTFFEVMPAESGMAFVVVLHLSPEHESILPQLLQRVTRMPVIQVTQREKVEANTVYVIPPGKLLTSADGQLTLTDMVPEKGRRVSVDLFFRTLADTHGPHATAVVLSGADADGAIGIKRIKERGGLTIAQTPDESEFSGMPRAAIATGMVDWVLEVREMPQRLLDYQRREKQLKVPPEEGPQPAAAPRSSANEAESALRDVLTFLRTRTGRDFTYYKRATILRRIARRMQVNGVDDLTGYLTFLRTHPGEAGALLQDLLISVTNFYRDRDAFEALQHEIPRLFQNKGPGDTIRVWVSACATGEEAYSIAMLLAEHARRLESPPAIQIFATDLDEDVIRSARDGVYPETISADVSEDRLRKFFIKEHRGYRVRREIRETVLFAVHDLLKDSPFSRLDLITCRNLLIYLTREAQSRVCDIFHFALRPEGMLFLGSSESVEDGSPLFHVIDKKYRIYVQRATSRSGLPVPSGPSTLARALQEQERSKQGPVISRRAMESSMLVAGLRLESTTERGVSWGELHYKLIERFAAPSVVVDAEYDILHLSENAGRYLQVSGGEPTRNLLKLVHPMMRIELRAVLYRCAQTHEPAEVMGVPIELDGEQLSMTMRTAPADDVLAGAQLVVFEAHRPSATTAEQPVHVESDREPAARQLERELERLKSHLRDTVEQYEASTEELKAGNEELQAMNEELRSATEELETSREELQSINEELTTVNQELKSKVDELGNANSDLHNLMASTAIGTIFLDRKLRITRYTPHAVSLFNLIPTDIGRPLSDLTRRLDYSELQDDAQGVLERLVPVEREVGNAEGNWYLARLLPYRTIDDRIAGVVLTFVDITDRKNAERAERQIAAEFQAYFELSSVGMVQTDPETHRFLRVNRKFCEMLGFSEAELSHRPISDVTHPEDYPVVHEHCDRLSRGEIREFSLDIRLLKKGGEPFWVHVNVTMLWDASGAPVRAVAVILDIADRKRVEEAIQRSEERLREANSVLDERVRERTRELSESEHRLRATADTASERAQQLQSLAAELTDAEQRERRRVAVILHDHIQQMLVAARMRVDLARAEIGDRSTLERLDAATSCINDAMNAARTLAIELVPPLLHDQGLPAALEWLGSQFAEKNHLQVDVAADRDANPYDEQARDLLFQAARELLLNVVKHAQTSRAWLVVERIDGQVVLEVRDDGVGFNPSDLSAGNHSFGLFHIRERIEAIGGALRVESEPGNGARVAVQMPRRL